MTVIAVVIAALARWLLSPLLANSAPFGTFIVAVIFCAWYGGLRASLLAMTLGFVVAFTFFISPYSSGSEAVSSSITRYGVYFMICLAIALFGEATRRAQHRSQQAEQFARQQAQTLRITFDSIGDAVITADLRGRITFINPVAQRLTGWLPELAIQRPLESVFKVIDERTRQPLETLAAQVLRDGKTVAHREHTVLIASDGSERPIEDSASPIRGDDETIVGIVLVFRDVTEVRQALDARLRLAAIVESSDDAVISEDLDGTIVSWNKGAERLYGYSADEMVGEPVSRMIPADHLSELPGILGRLREGQTVDHHETVRVRKDGTRLNVSVTISPIRNSEGQVVGGAKIARDISQRKRMEAMTRFLADSSSALAVLVDYETTLQNIASLSVPFFADWAAVDLITADGSLNRVAVAHRDPSQVRAAQEMRKRFPPDPAANYGIWGIIRTGKSRLVSEMSDAVLATTIKNPDLLKYLLTLGIRSYIGVPLNVRGQTLGVITFLTAESGRRYDKQDLILAQELAQRAAIALENARLYQNLKVADRRKDEFLATLAHELRNPLAPIRNGLEILRLHESGGSELTEVRELMQRQVQHMVRLVDDLLDVSRISRNKLELRKQQIELATVVQSAIETSRPLIDANQHQLTVNMPEQPLNVEADPVRLSQVFANLLNNAAKYTDPGGQIDLKIFQENRQAVIAIKDSGVGIPKEMLKDIFQMFTQLDHSLERSQSGLGLGLTVVQRLVEMHGGSVEAHSSGSHQGSEFIVRLPLTVVDNVERQPQPLSEEFSAAAARRILIVDDNRDSADTLAMLLDLMGHQTQKAYDGHEAIQVTKSFRPQIIMLDIGLPKMNGYDVCREIRQEDWGQRITIIALTGWGQEEDRKKSKAAGVDGHLVKPLNPQALMNLLAELEPSAAIAPR